MSLVADRISLSRGSRTILSDVSAVFPPGRISVILGPNGAGKSTLLEALAGLLPPASGQVTLGDVPLAGMAAQDRARAVGYLPQGGTVHWNLAVDELVALGRLPHRGAFGGLSAADRAAIDDALAATDLVGLRHRPVNQLSGGERARVLLARVLAGAPRVLLADEPLANLDPRHALDALRLFRAAADAGAAVVLVLHDLQAAARSADQLLLLAEGRCLAAGPPEAVLTQALLRQAYGVEMRLVRDGEAGLLPVPLG
jgi:iron complex transport system ATP-binding protein